MKTDGDRVEAGRNVKVGMRQRRKIGPLESFARTKAGTIVRQANHSLQVQNLGAPKIQ